MVKGFWRKLGANKPLNQMIFISAGTLAGIVFLLVNILSAQYESFACDEIYRSASGRINQATSTIQFLSEYVNTLLMQCSQSSNVNKLFMAENYSSSEIYNAKRELDNIRYNNSKIYSIYVYDQYSDVIFESCEFSREFENKREQFYDTGFLACMQDMENIRVFTPVVRTIPVIRDNAPETYMKVLTYFYFEPYFGSAQEKHSIIAFNVSISWMQEALGHFYGATPDVNDIEIVDRNGQIVFSDKEALIGSPYADTELLQNILDSDKDYGYFVEKQGGRLITFSRSSYTGYEDWLFIADGDLRTVMEPVRDLRTLVYLITGAVLLVSILGLTAVLRRFSAPIRQAFHKAQLLEREQKEKQKREAAEYVKQLLEGDIEEDTSVIREKFERFHIKYDFSEDNTLVLLSLDDRSSLHRKFRNRYADVLHTAEEMIKTAFAAYFDKTLSVEWREGVLIMVVCVPKEENARLRKTLEKIVDEVSRNLQEAIPCTVSVSISSRGESIKDLPFLMTEALEIHTYRYLYGYGKVLDAGVMENRTQESYLYPKEAEKEVLGCLFAGKQEETGAAYENYVKTLSCMSVPEIRISFLLLADAIKYASRNTVAETSNVLMNFEQFFAKIQSLETMEEVNHLFLHLFQEITEMIEEQKNARYAELIHYVEEYVREHYGRIELSIQEIAGKTDMSAAYLGRIFKQHTDTTFTEYLTGYRLERACEELLDSDRTVGEISDRVGFTNSSYFYLVFKKYLNCTPTQYRKNGKEQAASSDEA